MTLILRPRYLLGAVSVVAVFNGVLAAQATRPGTREQPKVQYELSAGPVAITMARAPIAMVLQGDGRLVAFDTQKGAVGSSVYRIPSNYQAADVAAVPFQNDAIVCFTLNGGPTGEYGSFVLQLIPGRKEVWNWLPKRGVYIGVAIDPDTGFAYAANSTDNGIYRVKLGDGRAPVNAVAYLANAQRIGALAIDSAAGRLFVSDTETGRLYVVSLGKATRVSSIALEGSEDIRAVTWSSAARRVFVADAAQEAVWSVDPDGRTAPIRIRDPRFREPAGLTVAGDGSVWLVDEGARMVFQLSPSEGTVTRGVKWQSRDE